MLTPQYGRKAETPGRHEKADCGKERTAEPTRLTLRCTASPPGTDSAEAEGCVWASQQSRLVVRSEDKRKQQPDDGRLAGESPSGQRRVKIEKPQQRQMPNTTNADAALQREESLSCPHRSKITRKTSSPWITGHRQASNIPSRLASAGNPSPQCMASM